MDSLVFTRVADELGARLPGSLLQRLEQLEARKFRLTFDLGAATLPLVASLSPESSWIGRASRRWDGPVWSPDPFAVSASRALSGRPVLAVSQVGGDRTLRFDFQDGLSLVLELGTRGANFVLLGAGDVVQATLSGPYASPGRLTEGSPYAPRVIPAGRLALTATTEAIDAWAASRDLEDAFLGVGGDTVELVREESRVQGRSAGAVFRERLDAVLAGRTEVVTEGPEPPFEAVSAGRFTPDRFRILPWRPESPRPGCELFATDDASGTAGLFHESRDAAARLAARLSGLRAILRAERKRTLEAARKARVSRDSFGDPEIAGRHGEALLAGLARARREGDTVRVPDPYDAEGAEIVIPAPAGRPLTALADDLFKKQRRGRRGRLAAEARVAALAAKVSRLDLLGREHASAVSAAEAASLEEEMRAAGLAVGLARSPRAARAAAQARAPRLAGVRMIRSADGATILVGRTGRDNDVLTFKLAAPEDLWLHAEGVPGAHVVVRMDGPGSRVSPATLQQAARLAAWFSDARSEGQVDVQWTRRKHVKRVRGGGNGTVTLKRFETVRVRPERPEGDP